MNGTMLGLAAFLCASALACAQPAVDELEEQLGRQQQPVEEVDESDEPPRPPLPARPEPGYLGAILDDARQAGGVPILDVLKDGPADKAGLRVGDVITGVNGKPVGRIDDMTQFVTASAAGTKLQFQVERGGRQGEVEVTLGVRPPATEVQFPRFGRPRDERPDDVEGPAALLGVRTTTLDDAARRRLAVPVARGALVVTIHVDSPAERAGVPLDAVIVGVDRHAVDSPDDLARWIRQAGPDREIELSYYRGRTFVRQRLRLAGDPPDAGQRIETLERKVQELERRLLELEKRVPPG